MELNAGPGADPLPTIRRRGSVPVHDGTLIVLIGHGLLRGGKQSVFISKIRVPIESNLPSRRTILVPNGVGLLLKTDLGDFEDQ